MLSALFGLVQGGLVPAYTVIIREFFPAAEAGMRVGMVLMATVFGMALGGWMSGVIYDITGSYQAAFVNGILWNVLNLGIAVLLLQRPGMSLDSARGYFAPGARNAGPSASTPRAGGPFGARQRRGRRARRR